MEKQEKLKKTEKKHPCSSIERILESVKEKLKNEPRLYTIFKNCYTDTLDKTVKKMEDGTMYVVTGDIPAMWLRDSSAQLRPYLIAAKDDPAVGDILTGLSRRQFQYIHTDPYANAFNETANGKCWRYDDTEMGRWVWERKYEVDSLCYPLQFAYLIWRNTGRTDQFDRTFRKGAERILEVFRTEQYHEEESPYRFFRKDTYFTDTLSRDGKGALVKSGIGMTWSGFRPSDDACVYGYLIPANMFAVTALGYLEEIADKIFHDSKLKADAGKLKREIYEGIERYGIVRTEEFGEVYAYEADGYGQYLLMDDANVPSLLSMDYLGYKGKLGLWCGNNEMEMFVEEGHHWVTKKTEVRDYIIMYEQLIPEVLEKYDPQTFYWPASPSSGGAFDEPNSPDRGDVHYWKVWHGNRPFSEYRKYFFRYASEFGFQSVPAGKTIETFTDNPKDRNLFSYVMEKHQRQYGANGKIMNYLQQTYLYPTDFETLIYASQLLQADAIRYGVEHFRRNRGRCMGAIVWQLNDCWPVISWSSIDYCGRWKALHYAEKRFFAPLMLSCEEEGMMTQEADMNREHFVFEKSIRLNVANETRNEQRVLVSWALRDARRGAARRGDKGGDSSRAFFRMAG